MLTKKGGPEVLATVERPWPETGPGGLRVKMNAKGLAEAAISGSLRFRGNGKTIIFEYFRNF